MAVVLGVGLGLGLSRHAGTGGLSVKMDPSVKMDLLTSIKQKLLQDPPPIAISLLLPNMSTQSINPEEFVNQTTQLENAIDSVSPVERDLVSCMSH